LPGWFRLILKASRPALPRLKKLALQRTQMSEEQFAQEYECSFEAAVIGAYYGKLMAAGRCDKPSRITGVPYEPTAQVYTAWDLGIEIHSNMVRSSYRA
jgi:phage terminase large subunit